jgi:4-hydroxy-2-oxoheptanedioate aldolase
MHQELKDAIDKIKEAAHAEGKKVGIYCTDGQQAQGYAQRGFDFISVCTDFPAITATFAGAVRTAKGEATGNDSGRVKGYDGR